MRVAAIGVVIAGIVGAFAYAGGWLSPHTLSPSSMIDTFEKVNGPHPGFRRNHAKGVCVSGYFESNGRGVELSKAVGLLGRSGAGDRAVRAGGRPALRRRRTPNRAQHGACVQAARRRRMAYGHEQHSRFPVNTAEAFHDQLLASALNPATGKPDPAKMNAFLANHPETARAMQSIRNHPVSSGFDNSTYNSLNAFLFIAAQGTVVPVRWSMLPLQPFEPIGMADPGRGDTNYLFNALIASIHSHPLQWRLVLTVGRPGDPTNDATIAWPPDRQQIDVGTLTIDRVESEDTSPARDINFDPLVLPDGMAASDDPLLSARSATYSQSFTRREGEHKEPSAVSTAETER